MPDVNNRTQQRKTITSRHRLIRCIFRLRNNTYRSSCTHRWPLPCSPRNSLNMSSRKETTCYSSRKPCTGNLRNRCRQPDRHHQSDPKCRNRRQNLRRPAVPALNHSARCQPCLNQSRFHPCRCCLYFRCCLNFRRKLRKTELKLPKKRKIKVIFF